MCACMRLHFMILPIKLLLYCASVCFVYTAIMCSTMMKITIICIYMIDKGLSHEEWNRQSGGSESSSAGE